MRFAPSTVLAAAAAGVAVVAGSAYTAGVDGVPQVSVGQGVSVTAGYVVSAVDYDFGTSAATAANIVNVDFTLAVEDLPGVVEAPPVYVGVRLTSGVLYSTCDKGVGSAYTCTVDVPASAATQLDILASSLDPGSP